MTASTSIDAYREAIANGTISKARARVLEAACRLGPNFSQADICRALGTNPTDFRRFAPRVRELELMGVLRATGTKEDPQSGMKVKVYRVTGADPTPIPKRLGTSQLHRKMYDYLTDTVASKGSMSAEEALLIEQLRQRLRLPS